MCGMGGVLVGVLFDGGARGGGGGGYLRYRY